MAVALPGRVVVARLPGLDDVREVHGQTPSHAKRVPDLSVVEPELALLRVEQRAARADLPPSPAQACAGGMSAARSVARLRIKYTSAAASAAVGMSLPRSQILVMTLVCMSLRWR